MRTLGRHKLQVVDDERRQKMSRRIPSQDEQSGRSQHERAPTWTCRPVSRLTCRIAPVWQENGLNLQHAADPREA